MSEEECPKYKDGDIVWVKLGSCWWPGEVTEDGPEDFSAKKPPLAIVKFFNETTYEFVKSPNNIYLYNCERKNEFIKKGMDSFRANNSHMEKFPGDVSLAEIRTDGNPNILSDPIFAPQKKSNIIAEVFGTPSPKKAHREGARHSRGRGSSSKHSGKKPVKVNITHRRFLGCDDYEAHIRVQYPGKDTGHVSSDEEIARLNAEPSQSFNCSTCPFQTNRLEVMLFHVQCHIKGIASPVQVKKKAIPKKTKKPRVKHITSDDDRTNSSAGFLDTDSEEDKPKPKRKKRTPGTVKKPKPKKVEEEEEKTVTDIRTNLLAEWSDSEDNEELDTTTTTKHETSGESVEKNIEVSDREKEKVTETKTETKTEEQSNNQQKDLSKSCFDFEEEEEEDNSVVHTALGRKIPRVIPPSEKRRSTDPDNEDASLPIAEDDENRMEILKVSESLSENSVQNDGDVPKEESVFKDLMESTSVPELPEVPETIKPPQNFPDSKLIKIPDKKIENVTEVATKLTNPKKRFVKSFEDFELLLNEQRRAQEEREEELRREKDRAVVVEPVQSVEVVKEIEDKIVDPVEEKVAEPVEEKAEEIVETSVVEEPVEEKVEEPIIEPVEEVKVLVEPPKVEETIPEPEEPKIPEVIEETKDDSNKNVEEMEIEETREAIPEEKLNEAVKTFDTNVQISKLKCQIMSKLSDEEAEASKISPPKTKPSHRTPRSKILESYRNDRFNEQKAAKEETEESVANSSKKEIHAPKKSKYLKFNQEVVAPVEKIEEESPAKQEKIEEESPPHQEKIEEESPPKQESPLKEEPPPLEESPPKEELPPKVESPSKVESPPKVESPVREELPAKEELPPKEESPPREESPAKDTKSDVIKEVEAIPEKNLDEEIGKVSQIDEYFNDFLFNFEKKSGSHKIDEEEEDTTQSSEEKSSNEVVHIKCAGNDENEPPMDIAIKTNLTNFSRNEEEMSALSTLAMVSQLETSLDKPSEEIIEKVEKVPEEEETQPVKTIFEGNFPKKPDSELITIDGNLTVVSEKDLADGQVEITANASPTYKKPVTLTNFSMDFSECNSNSTSDSLSSERSDLKAEEPKEKEVEKKVLPTDGLFDLEEHIPSQIVDKAKPTLGQSSTMTSKLLERLTTSNESKISTPKSSKVPTIKDSTKPAKTKFVIKSAGGNKIIKGTPSQSSKPIIISEKIIKPSKVTSDGVSVQKITSKRNLHDPDEIDTFIIQKGAKATFDDDDELELSEDLSNEVPTKRFKRSTSGMESTKKQVTSTSSSVKKRGKAKILQQTIITPAGEIIQPTATKPPATTTATPSQPDDNVFDINSMPIVLSDQILTPESIANMPIFLSETVQPTPPEPVTTVAAVTTAAKVTTTTVKKAQTTPSQGGHMRLLNKSIASSPNLLENKTKLVKTPKIIGSMGSKILKQNSFPSGSSKHGKYVIVTQSPPSTPPSKYTVGKKQALIKRSAADLGISPTGTLTKVQNLSPEPSGNKIMILTNQQGQQQRVLLTPAQQKMMGYQNQGTKVTKTLVKGNILQKAKDGQMTPVPGSSGILSKSVPSRLNSNQTMISSSHVLTPIHTQQTKSVRIDKSSIPPRKLQLQTQKVHLKPQKTILIKNQHGQTVRKIQGTDDALLDQQVAEQIEAIKASGVLQQKQEILNYKTGPPKSFRRSYAKKMFESPKLGKMQTPKADVPPLAPISPKKYEHAHLPTMPQEKVSSQTDTKGQQDRPLNQLVIQDAMGNQTTITEGQILALPSETVDGQPQSYMLVTLDESGNLTPLNNEALLSLDPNLGLGGDLGNTVLQIDQSALKEETVSQPEQAPEPEVAKAEVSPPVPEAVKEDLVVEEPEKVTEPAQEQIVESSVMQSVNCNVGGEPGQQLIVTGDPIAAQKFLESLAEGSTDLANILASAEGSNILIHADGQQILINTDSDNQMLLSVNTDLNMAESSEGGGNPIFATQPSKNQDILAAALADTDVFQQEQNGTQGKVLQSQLSPNSTLYPMNVGNVLETSLTLNSPIMTPLEVPSTNTKKISDESDILSQVPKNVDLPITITDPNISQTVSQQQVASLMVNELQSNLELSLPISESAITVASSDMNSPNFVYSLPNLDGGVDMNQKPFNSSMPLLTEDTEEPPKDKDEESEVKPTEDEKIMESEDKDSKMASDGSFMDESEGLCTLGGEMCSSLSEPPPDMFDLSAVLSSHQIKASPKEETVEEGGLKIEDKDESASSESVNQETASVTETSSPNTMNEDSCEIPVQPEIVTTLKDEGFEDATSKRAGDEVENESKKCKFD